MGGGGGLGAILTPTATIGKQIFGGSSAAGKAAGQIFDPLGLNKDHDYVAPNDMAMPNRPEYNSLLDPATGLLKSQYQTGYNPDMSGIDAMKAKALATGPSAWATQALGQQGLEEQGLKNSAQQQAASAAAQARSGLASKYGLSSGANTSLAKSNMRDQMSGLQNIGAQGAQTRAGIGVQDELNKNGMLPQLIGAQTTNAQNQYTAQNQNVTNAMNEANAKRMADLSAYHEQMGVYGANKNANAMQASGGGGGKK